MFQAKKFDPTKFGYTKKGHGFFKEILNDDVTEVHWITLFDKNQAQLYAYNKDDNQFEDIYNTQVRTFETAEELETFIKVFTRI